MSASDVRKGVEKTSLCNISEYFMNTTEETLPHQFDILDHLSLGAFVLQKDFRVVFWNSVLEDWTGISRNQIVGKPVGAYFPHLNTPRYAIRIQDVFKSGMPFVFSSYLHKYILPVTMPDDHYQIQSATVTRVPDMYGNGSYVLCSIQDVTELTRRISDYRTMRDQAQKEVAERKQAEAQLLAANMRLTETLDELQKTQTHLVESEKMAALGQLVAGIAHEINSPLGAIRSSIESIMQELQQMLVELPDFLHKLSDERRQDFFALLEHAQQRDLSFSPKEERKHRRTVTQVLDEHGVDNPRKVADTLVDMGVYEDVKPFLPLLQSRQLTKILDMAYQVSGLQESTHTIMTAANRVSKVVFALRTYARYDYSGEVSDANVIEGIETILTLYHNQIKHGVEVVRQYDDIQPIRGYPDELNQVWTNLIHNALQAMEYNGTLTLEVRQNESQVVVSITDSGRGVPEDIQEKIFDPFFTTKPSGEGSGLGLDIVKRIIEKHEGKITFHSKPGHTTFSVSLPTSPTA